MVQSGSQTDELAARVVETLTTALSDRLVAVVLFGSRARGEGSDTSDWDLLVIAEGLPARVFDRNLYLKQLLPPECCGCLSILAKTPEQFRGAVSSLYLDIALDGRILYDARGFAEERLGWLRRQIGQLGLRRERTPEGSDWRWESQPRSQDAGPYPGSMPPGLLPQTVW
jgi:predicted nucleotidyltransferase